MHKVEIAQFKQKRVFLLLFKFIEFIERWNAAIADSLLLFYKIFKCL